MLYKLFKNTSFTFNVSSVCLQNPLQSMLLIFLDSCFLKANDLTHSLSSYLKEGK